MAGARSLRPVVGILALIVLIALLRPRDRKPVPSAGSGPKGHPIPYSVVQTWDIPCSGRVGEGRVIVVDSQYRADSALRQLGAQLHKERPEEWCSNVEVFDDSVLATDRDAGLAQKLPKARQLKFDTHYLGLYLRNRHTGHAQWDFGLRGLINDPLVTIKY